MGELVGAFLMNFVSQKIVNPDNEEADIVVTKDEKYFSEHIAKNVPRMF